MVAEFTVLLTKPEQRDPMALAKALAAIRRTPLQDQVLPARSCWGIVEEHLNEAAARAMAESLKASGFESRVVAGAGVAVLPAEEPAIRYDPGFVDGLILVAAAGITVSSTTTHTVKEGPSGAQKILNVGLMMATGLPIKVGGKERTVVKTQQQSDLVFYLDLVYEKPSRRRRIDAQHFDYSFLKERKLYNILGNFKLLLGDLTAAVPTATRNHGTRVLLQNQPVQTMGYQSLADLERESRWLITLRHQ